MLFNLTAVNTTQRGFLSVTAGDATALGGGSINWSDTGQVLDNGTSAPLDGSRQVKVWAGGLGTTDFVIDITGYFA